MAYSSNAGDIIALNSGPATMTIGIPLHAYTGAIDPLTLWKTQPAIRTVVDFIAWTLAGVPLNVYRAEGEDRQRVRDGAIAEALRRPGRRVTPFNLRRDLLIDRLIYDRWVLYIHTPAPGRIELLQIPAALTTILTTPLGTPTGVRVGFPAGGNAYDLPLEQVLFDVGYSPEIGAEYTTGFSTLYTLRDLAEEMKSSTDYRKDLWRNSAMIPAVITRPANAPSKGWNETERKRFLSDFAKYKAGGGKEGGIPLLQDGMKLEKADVFSPADAQYIEVRKLAIAEVASAFRVPPELVGAREGNYSNIAAYREQLYQDVLGPWVMAFEQAFDTGLAQHLGDGEWIEANIDAKLRASFVERTQAMQSSVGAPWRTRNEARKLDNLPAVDGGDELIVPLNVLEGGLASPRDTAPKA